MNTQSQYTAVAPARPACAPACGPFPAFPPYSVTDGVVLIKLRAKNGYVHSFRVGAEEIPFLKLCWPFEVSTGGKRKKIVRRIGSNGHGAGKVFLHLLWLAYYRHNLPSHRGFSRKPKCRNNNWLDWTEDNVYLPEVNQESAARREVYLSNRLSETAKDLIYARTCGALQPIPSDDPEIVWAFQDAARMPARSIRPKATGPDSFTAESDGGGYTALAKQPWQGHLSAWSAGAALNGRPFV